MTENPSRPPLSPFPGGHITSSVIQGVKVQRLYFLSLKKKSIVNLTLSNLISLRHRCCLQPRQIFLNQLLEITYSKEFTAEREGFIIIYLLSEADIAVRFFRCHWSIAHVPSPGCRTCFYLHKALGKVLSCIDWPVQGSLMCSCIDHPVCSWKAVLRRVHLKRSREKGKLSCRCLNFIQMLLWV